MLDTYAVGLLAHLEGITFPYYFAASRLVDCWLALGLDREGISDKPIEFARSALATERQADQLTQLKQPIFPEHEALRRAHTLHARSSDRAGPRWRRPTSWAWVCCRFSPRGPSTITSNRAGSFSVLSGRRRGARRTLCRHVPRQAPRSAATGHG
jgi:hypothetical protein